MILLRPRKRQPNWSLPQKVPLIKIDNIYGSGRHLKGRELERRRKELERRELEMAKHKGTN